MWLWVWVWSWGVGSPARCSMVVLHPLLRITLAKPWLTPRPACLFEPCLSPPPCLPACCSYMAALLQPYSSNGLDPAWLEPAPKKCRMGVELLSCSS